MLKSDVIVIVCKKDQHWGFSPNHGADTRKTLLIWLLLLLPWSTMAQKEVIDQLEVRLDDPSVHDTTRLQILIELSEQWNYFDPVKAYDYAYYAHSLASARGDSSKTATSYLNRNLHWVHLGHYGQSFIALTKINGMLAENLPPHEKARLYYFLGISIAETDTTFVDDFFSKAIDLYQSSQDTLGWIEALCNRGFALNQNTIKEQGINSALEVIGGSHYLRALKLYEQWSEASKDSFGQQVAKATIYSFIGRLYRDWPQTDTAVWYFSNALDIYNKYEMPAGRSDMHINIGRCYILHKDSLDQAVDHLIRGYEIGQKLGHIDRQASALMHISRFLLARKERPNDHIIKTHTLKALNRLGDLENLLKFVERLGEQINSKYILKNACLNLLHYYKLTDQKELQLTYRTRYASISYLDLANDNTLQLLESRSRALQAEQAQQILEKQKELESERAQSFQNILLITSMSLLVVVIMSFLIYRQSRIRKEQNKELVLMNEQVDQQKRRIEGLLREKRHRTSNDWLRIEGAIYDGKREGHSDEEVLENVTRQIDILKEIHDLLDRRSNQVDVLELFDLLLTRIDEKVTVEKKITSIQLAPLVLTKLGLIVNELFTNISKYAFHDATNPKLTVKFSEKDLEYCLLVKNNGSKSGDGPGSQRGTGYGMGLISSLLKDDLDGIFEISHENGYSFQAKFPKT